MTVEDLQCTDCEFVGDCDDCITSNHGLMCPVCYYNVVLRSGVTEEPSVPASISNTR